MFIVEVFIMYFGWLLSSLRAVGFFIAITVCGIASAMDLNYDIRPVEERGRKALEVSLRFQGNKSGVTEIELPSKWAAQERLYQNITQLEAIASTIESTHRPEIKKVFHRPNEMITIRYLVQSSKEKEEQWYHRPLIEENHFFFLGNGFFVLPHANKQESNAITIEWQNFPEDWSIANSFGVHARKQELSASLADFQNTVFTGGDFQILQCGTSSAPIYVAIRGEWSFSNKKFCEMAETIIESQRTFWGDHAFPHYLITVFPIGSDPQVGGTSLHNAFSLFMQDISEKNHNEWKWLTRLLSHEHFHVWNGLRMSSEPPEGSMFWFTEGFTEYYGATLNLRNGVFSLEDYVDHMNSILYDYYTSPARNEKNATVETGFWKDRYIQRLPYVRGCLLAMLWDKKIRDKTSNKYSLDDVMFLLMKRIQANKTPFSQKDVEELVGTFLGDEAALDIASFITNGETLVPFSDAFSEPYTLEWIEDIGFNISKSESVGSIQGVIQGSLAYKAGLRNGRKFVGHHLTDTEVQVFTSKKEGEVQEMSYERTPAQTIPQYTHTHIVNEELLS